jgi:UPF0716 family protein affecting phage T7 exclusion
MKSNFFKPNIEKQGRIARARLGAVCVVAGIVAAFFCLWPGVVLVAAGVFALFEAARGWCVARACGIKTKM